MTEMPSAPEPATEAAVRLTGAVRAMTEAMRPVVQAYLAAAHQFAAAARPIVEWAEQHPQELARWQREREAEERLGSCHCLCGTHRELAQGVCEGIAAPSLTVRFNSPTVGPQDVAMCHPCYQAQQLARA